jgi:hypothetical protein
VVVRHQFFWSGRGLLSPVWHHAGVEEPLTCSARGCTAPAVWAVLWNNPRLHTPERRKTWLACEEHRESLSNFLAARSFLKDVVPVEEAPSEG